MIFILNFCMGLLGLCLILWVEKVVLFFRQFFLVVRNVQLVFFFSFSLNMLFFLMVIFFLWGLNCICMVELGNGLWLSIMLFGLVGILYSFFRIKFLSNSLYLIFFGGFLFCMIFFGGSFCLVKWQMLLFLIFFFCWEVKYLEYSIFLFCLGVLQLMMYLKLLELELMGGFRLYGEVQFWFCNWQVLKILSLFILVCFWEEKQRVFLFMKGNILLVLVLIIFVMS